MYVYLYKIQSTRVLKYVNQTTIDSQQLISTVINVFVLREIHKWLESNFGSILLSWKPYKEADKRVRLIAWRNRST